jgi:hypothetical protein
MTKSPFPRTSAAPGGGAIRPTMLGFQSVCLLTHGIIAMDGWNLESREPDGSGKSAKL